MMDAESRALFDRSLQHATSSHTGVDLDGALDELGWADALAEDPEVALSLLFGHQGFANATSSGLDRVLTDALDIEADAMVLPALGRTDPPGNGTTIAGLGTATLARAKTAAVPLTKTPDCPKAATPALAFTADGRTLIAGCRNHRVYEWAVPPVT